MDKHTSEETRSSIISGLVTATNKSMKFSEFSTSHCYLMSLTVQFLTSSVFFVVVGKENQKTFLLHSELLAYESDRLVKNVKGGFDEQSTKIILLDEEDSELFGYFVEYLYRREWLAEKEALRIQITLLSLVFILLGKDFRRINFNMLPYGSSPCPSRIVPHYQIRVFATS